MLARDGGELSCGKFGDIADWIEEPLHLRRVRTFS